MQTQTRTGLRIVLLGKTGAGKSSLVNALLEGDYQKIGVRPTTTEARTFSWAKQGERTVALVDLPGALEAGKSAEIDDILLEQLAQAHLVLLVVGAPDRALDYEVSLLQQIRDIEPNMPVVVAANQIDKLSPSREWKPTSLNLQVPSTEKERNIRQWLDYIRTQCGHDAAGAVIPCAAGERWDDKEGCYNLPVLAEIIKSKLPDAQKLEYIRLDALLAGRESKAQAIIWAAAIAAAAAAVIPIPLADAAVITPIQIGMIISLAGIHGRIISWSQAAGLVGPAIGFLVGPLLFQQLIKLLPGAGSFIAPGVAGVITLALGQAFNTFFLRGNFSPSSDELKKEIKKRYTESKGRKKEFKR